jgi:hypothetical protein
LADSYVASPLTDVGLTEVAAWYGRLDSHRDLQRVSTLFLASLEAAADRLRSFLAAWNALEIIVAKVFPEYEELTFAQAGVGGETASLQRYIRRIQDVMKDKYGLADKFALIAANLAPTAADDDLAQFVAAKKQRDILFHGGDVPESSLAVGQVQGLFRKYLRLHLARVNQMPPRAAI